MAVNADRSARDDWRWDAASVGVMFVISCIMASTIDAYGFTYDEQYHYTYGENVLNWFLTWGADDSALGHNHSYGVGYDLPHAILVRLLPFSPIDTARHLCVVVSLLGLLGTWRLSRWMGGSLGGFLGLGFLALTSVYYGQQFNNPKDIPFAAGYVWGLFYAIRSATEPRPSKRFWVAASVAFAAAMSVRLVGGVVIAYAGLAWLLVLVERWRRQRLPSRRAVVVRASRLGASVLAAGAMIAAAWPWLHSYPFIEQRPGKSGFASMVKFKGYDAPTLLHGEMVNSQDAPWDYIPTYFAMQLGEVLLLFAGFGFIALGVRWARVFLRRADIPVAESIVVVAILLPPSFAIINGSTVYNGLRHFLFLVPPIASLAAFGAALAVRAAAQRGRAWRWTRLALIGVLSLGLAEQLYSSIELHPQQQVYFNRASGGVRAAVGKYVTEYYGSTYAEISRSFSKRLWRAEPRRYLNQSYAVSGCGDEMFFEYNLPENFHYVWRRKAHLADYYLTYVRDNCHRHHRRSPVVHRLVKQGATLALARDMKARSKRSRKKKRKQR